MSRSPLSFSTPPSSRPRRTSSLTSVTPNSVDSKSNEGGDEFSESDGAQKNGRKPRKDSAKRKKRTKYELEELSDQDREDLSQEELDFDDSDAGDVCEDGSLKQGYQIAVARASVYVTYEKHANDNDGAVSHVRACLNNREQFSQERRAS